MKILSPVSIPVTFVLSVFLLHACSSDESADSGGSGGKKTIGTFARQVPVESKEVQVAFSEPTFFDSLVRSAYAATTITYPHLTISRLYVDEEDWPKGSPCRKLDFISKVTINPLSYSNGLLKKLVEGKVYQMSIRSVIEGSGMNSDDSSTPGVTKYGSDLAVSSSGGQNNWVSWVSIFKNTPISNYGQQDNCGYSNFAMSDDWKFELDTACTDAEIISESADGTAFIRVKSASANTASACTLTAKGKAMNPETYRNNTGDARYSEDYDLSHSEQFLTIDSETPDIPKVTAIKLDDKELPLGESVSFSIADLTAYYEGDEGVKENDGVTVSEVPSFCNPCNSITIEGSSITSASWRTSRGSSATNTTVFYWTPPEEGTQGSTAILLLASIENGSNVLIQKKALFYVSND